ncbi:MAG: hypothetical protein ING77_11610 [Rhodocyclaceae bacterium]|nr:hypothetical protein [Rhodocyclaceae bacterium]
MAWTKRQIVEQAFEELALAGYVFDLTPEELQSGLRRLDTMMATWEGKGVRVGYPIPSNPDESDLDQSSGLPDKAVEAVYLNLAIRLAASFGKVLGPDTKRSAREGYDTLLWAAAQPIEQQQPDTLARGAGNKPWRTNNQPFFPRPDDSPLGITQGGDLQISPE